MNLLHFVRLIEVKASEDEEDCEDNSISEEISSHPEATEKKSSFLSRRLSFSFTPCTEEEEEEKPSPTSSLPECEDNGDMDGNEQQLRGRPSFLARKIGCMFQGARYGLKEGCLSGVFFGGLWGALKFANNGFKNPGGGDNGGESRSQARAKPKPKPERSAEDDGNPDSEPNDDEGGGGGGGGSNTDNDTTESRNTESTTNNNIVFVCAYNGAIIMGVVCSLISCMKSLAFCH